MGRLSIALSILVSIPVLAAAQRAGGAASAPAGRPAVAISHTASAPHTVVRAPSGTAPAARLGAPIVRGRNNGVRTIHRANNGFNGSDFQDVPGLGFDYAHLAAISGNRRQRGGRFNGGFPFGFSGFLLSPPVIVEEAPTGESDAAVADEETVDEPPAARPSRHSRPPRALSEPQIVTEPVPQPDVEQYVFVRRDGGLVFAVGYTWENGILRYVTPEGLRRSIGRDALDLNATQQFNEQRGLSFRAPA